MKYTLELRNLPFEPQRNQIIYVENGYDEVVNQFILDNYERICDYCSQRKFEFCYLPKLTEQAIDEEVLFYNAPYVKSQEAPKSVGSDFLLQFLVQPKNRELIPPSLLYIGNRGRIKSAGDVVTFQAMSVTDQDVYPYVEDIFYWRLQDIFLEKEETEKVHERIEFSKKAPKDDGPKFSKEEQNFQIYRRISKDEILRRKMEELLFCMPDDGIMECREEPEPFRLNHADFMFDLESKRLADEVRNIKDKLERKGVSWAAVMEYVKGKEKLSRMLITKDYRIFLPDYNNMEIEMTPLDKAVYLLYLKHPDGIMFSFLPDFKKELTDIYQKVKPAGDPALAERSIEDITDCTKNSINEKCSHIRGAFIRHFAEHLAENYFITGKRGEPKTIKLPRELVIWEK